MIAKYNYQVREIRCKNDNCRNLLGYENLNYPGVLIIECSKCNQPTIMHIQYKQFGKELIERINKISEGGEK